MAIDIWLKKSGIVTPIERTSKEYKKIKQLVGTVLFHRHCQDRRLDVMGSVRKFNGFCVTPNLQHKKGPTVPRLAS